MEINENKIKCKLNIFDSSTKNKNYINKGLNVNSKLCKL